MLKGSRSSTSYVWNASIARNSFFISRKRKFILLGGVFLGCLLALIPNSASAYNELFIPNNDNRYVFTTDHRLQGGCYFTAYHGDGFDPYLGALLDGTHNCSYRYVNDHIGYYDESKFVGHSKLSYHRDSWSSGSPFDGVATTQGGYNILNTWSSSVSNSYGQHVYNTLDSISLTLEDCPLNSTCADGFNSNSGRDGYGIFVYSWKPVEGMAGVVGTVPRITSGFPFYNSLTGEYISDFGGSDFADVVSESIIYGAFSSEQLQNLLPDNMQQFNRGDDYMYIIGTIPTYQDKYFKTSMIYFYPERGIKYDWQLGNDVLGLDGYFNFLSFKPQASYKEVGTTLSMFDISDATFGVSYCMTTAECDYYSNFNNTYKGMHNSSLQPGGNQGGTQSIFMSWFNVFTLGFTFPFRALFNSFSDDQCVNIPNIAGLVGSSETQYCSWWPNSIKQITTPVFNIFSLMLITGFIVHWLSNRQQENGGST